MTIEYSLTDLTIIDNFLDEKDFLMFNEKLSSNKFPWTKTNIISPDDDPDKYGVESLFNVQMVHMTYLDIKPPTRDPGIQSKQFNVFLPLIKKIDPFHLLRIKANLTLNHGKQIGGCYHVDVGDWMGYGMTAVYYLETSNGYTKFKNGNIVESVKNRIAIFPNSWFHDGIRSTDVPYRIVINLNWLEKDLLPSENLEDFYSKILMPSHKFDRGADIRYAYPSDS